MAIQKQHPQGLRNKQNNTFSNSIAIIVKRNIIDSVTIMAKRNIVTNDVP